MGIGSAFQAVKQFVLAHKLAVGLTAAGATVTTVAYAKREAILDGIVMRSKKYRGLWAQQTVNEESIKQLDNELLRTRTELQVTKDALENSEAERDALLKDQSKTATKLGELDALKIKIEALQTHVDNLTKLNEQLEKDLSASKAREVNQQAEIQRLMGETDRLTELETPEASTEASSGKGSNAATPRKKRERAGANASATPPSETSSEKGTSAKA